MIGTFGAVSAASARSTVTNFLATMSASSDVLALAKVEVDMANIPEGKKKAARRTWTKEEDDRLRASMEKCQSWVEVAAQVGGRTDKMVRERWLLLKRRDEAQHAST